ncbi:hypothetical protein [Hymenobacter sp. UYP22]|uniref:hypothetical protein n=1 Tax=Hymenobacter sp. UYP22 TaxID=3156348 RepID=UPI003393D51A
MKITLPPLPESMLTAAGWLALALLLWLWLRKELTPTKIISIWETDGCLSARQILAWVVVLYGLFMRAAGRIDNAALESCFECGFILFGIGGAVKLAERIKPVTTTVNSKKTDIKTEAVKVENDSPREEYNIDAKP